MKINFNDLKIFTLYYAQSYQATTITLKYKILPKKQMYNINNITLNSCGNWAINPSKHNTGLSMNILRAGDKSSAQRGFFKNCVGDLLPALRFLGGLCNFCNYTFFNHSGM